jgi:putative holliday junction resolvase
MFHLLECERSHACSMADPLSVSGRASAPGPIPPGRLASMGRVVAIDLGSKRIGVASSDTTRTLASPYEVVERRGDHGADHRALRAIVEELEAELLVVGLPISLNGSEGAAARLIRSEVAELEAAMPVPVEVFDERFTTVTAHQALIGNNMRAKARRAVVDKVAAAVLLQTWLDAAALRRNENISSSSSSKGGAA